MAKRSRLGKGLGALFPALPGEDEEQESAQEAPEAQSSSKAETGKQTAAGETAASTTRSSKNQGSKGSGKKQAGKTSTASAGSTASTGETTSTKGASETMAATKSQRSRISVPKLSDLEHPSDLFFGGVDPAPAAKAGGTSEEEPSSTGSSDRKAAGRAQAASDSEAEGEAEGSEAIPQVQGGYLAELDLDDIRPNEEQPRSIFDEDELIELSHSITEVGLLQPIVVRKVTKPSSDPKYASASYELVMGERRWRATKLAGLDKIPAIVKTTSDDDMLRDALLENLHRVDLNPLEEAAAYQQMMDEFGMGQSELSLAISKSRSQIANTLRLLKLPPSVQKKLESGVLSAGHARALLTLATPEDMEEVADKIIAEGLSVRSTEELVALKEGSNAKKLREKKVNVWVDSPIQHNLENRFETKVSIKGNQKKGRIEIAFSSPEDMDRIVSLLLGDKANSADSQQTADGWV